VERRQEEIGEESPPYFCLSPLIPTVPLPLSTSSYLLPVPSFSISSSTSTTPCLAFFILPSLSLRPLHTPFSISLPSYHLLTLFPLPLTLLPTPFPPSSYPTIRHGEYRQSSEGDQSVLRWNGPRLPRHATHLSGA
jgi:hypothetical protein